MYSKLIVLACLLAVSHSNFVDVKVSQLLSRLNNRVAGSHDAKPGEFPHQASILINTVCYGMACPRESVHVCGGTIISEEWILTSATCCQIYEHMDEIIYNISSQHLHFFVEAGKHDLNKIEDTQQTVDVDKYFKHPKHAEDYSPYNIALIKLKVPLKFNKWVGAAALPDRFAEPTGNVVVSGWNEDWNGGWMEPKRLILQTATLPIVDRETCEKAIKDFGQQMPVFETNICTKSLSGEIYLCTGDVGGPLIKRSSSGDVEVVGVVSPYIREHPGNCAFKGVPSVYVKVSAFNDWIEDVMSQ